MSRTLILGGARSGKTARALSLAKPPRIYVATAQPLDSEMEERIALHRAERGDDWGVIETPLELALTLRQDFEPQTILLVDCLTLWLSNLIHHERDPEREITALLDAMRLCSADLIFVSNEIGLGLVPMEPLSRQFRDAQGRLNQRMAQACDRVEFVAAGLPLILKG